MKGGGELLGKLANDLTNGGKSLDNSVRRKKVKVFIADECCLCFGASRALSLAQEKLAEGKRVVLFKQILHNKRTTGKLLGAGAVQKDNLDEITSGDCVVIRAHGERKDTFDYLKGKGIEYADGTCPNVKAINLLVNGKNAEGYKIIIVGKYGKNGGKMHPEVAGTAGWCDNPIFVEDEEDIIAIPLDYSKYFLVVQTTFSCEKANALIQKAKDYLEQNGKQFEFRNTTCGAQKRINESSEKLAKNVDCMIVVGGKNSSNTKELFNNLSGKIKSFLVEGLDDVRVLVQQGELKNFEKIGLTGGASTVREELDEIKEYLEKYKKNNQNA